MAATEAPDEVPAADKPAPAAAAEPSAENRSRRLEGPERLPLAREEPLAACQRNQPRRPSSALPAEPAAEADLKHPIGLFREQAPIEERRRPPLSLSPNPRRTRRACFCPNRQRIEIPCGSAWPDVATAPSLSLATVGSGSRSGNRRGSTRTAATTSEQPTASKARAETAEQPAEETPPGSPE